MFFVMICFRIIEMKKCHQSCLTCIVYLILALLRRRNSECCANGCRDDLCLHGHALAVVVVTARLSTADRTVGVHLRGCALACVVCAVICVRVRVCACVCVRACGDECVVS